MMIDEAWKIQVDRQLQTLMDFFRMQAGNNFLQTPLAGSWGGLNVSTTPKTKIDLSDIFGVPPSIRSVLLYVSYHDSGSAGSDCQIIFSPNDTAGAGTSVGSFGLPDDKWTFGQVIVPCNDEGDIYFQITASGASTMDVYIQVLGYWV